MTPEQLAEVLAAHRAWLRGEGGERADLRGADLRGANLSGADLTRADLYGANLSDANLTRTGLNYAQVTWTSHGECGRMLTAVRIADEIRLFCGCFRGTPDDLRAYIDEGEGALKASRTRALEIVLELMELNTESKR